MRCCTRTVRHPKLFDGLLLQSGSFFRQRSDKQERTFPALPADHEVHRHGAPRPRRRADDPCRDHLRHGRGEPREQRDVAAALRAQGYPAWLGLVRDAHNWTCWRDAFDPHLPALIEAVGMNRRVVDIDGGSVIAYGYYGRPLVAFPSENGEP